MTETRRDPLGVLASPPARVNQAKHKVVAAIQNDLVGVCPVCRVEMLRSFCKDIAVYYCPEHAVVLPVENS